MKTKGGSNRGASGSAGSLTRLPERSVPGEQVGVERLHAVADEGMQTLLQ